MQFFKFRVGNKLPTLRVVGVISWLRSFALLRMTETGEGRELLFDPGGVVTMGWGWYPGFHPGLFIFDPYGVGRDRVRDDRFEA